ncbi:CRE-SET-3 protein [Caenorhabditis remanei]|uniref:CRE-SET-3 protein n=1 Tax=Caenorhabditis remanei TaxID=31234 RepID=E3LS98_CAERE|nr:CRE-SET-3 protein [Caenorhabditis remanei]
MVSVSSFKPNANYPELCDKVTIDWDEKRGRFIKAIEDIPLGTVVCIEEGITVNVDSRCCYRCLKLLGNDGFVYCRSCEKFNEPSEIACGEFDSLGIFKLAAHLVFSYPFAEITNLVTSDEPEVPRGLSKTLSTKDVQSVYQLKPFLGIEDSFKTKIVQEAIVKIVKLLEADANWGLLEEPSRLITFTKALRLMAERCAKNAHTIYSIEQIEKKDEDVPIGTGLFPISSIFNHSCTPNVFGFFVRNTFIFVSRGVKSGEELVDSYGVTYNQHSLKQREEFLANVSGFKCHCDSCVEQKSLEDYLEKSFKDVDRSAREASSFLDISDYIDYMKPGVQDIENLISAFSQRRDAEVYSKNLFYWWKKFIENANYRKIVYDPYLIRPYIEMVLLTWNNDVECTVDEKLSILTVAHRLLSNFYVGFHPISELIKKLFEASMNPIDEIRNIETFRILKQRAEILWKREEYI